MQKHYAYVPLREVCRHDLTKTRNERTIIFQQRCAALRMVTEAILLHGIDGNVSPLHFCFILSIEESYASLPARQLPKCIVVGMRVVNVGTDRA